MLCKCFFPSCFCCAKILHLHNGIAQRTAFIILIIFNDMARVIIFKRTTKKDGEIRLRFRLTDGRKTDLYHKSGIMASLKDLDKFEITGNLKPKVSVYNKDLFQAITNEISIMKKVYLDMVETGKPINGDTFEALIEKELHPDKAKEEKDSDKCLLARFDTFIERGFRDGVFGEGRKKHYKVLLKELERFLIINKLDEIKPGEFTEIQLMDFRSFMFDEYQYVDIWRGLYAGMREHNIPKMKRGVNTVSGKMSQLQAFFRELEDKEEIVKSPFRKLGDSRKKLVLRERYDDPVFLTKEEFLRVKEAVVPDALQETKDAFLLQCAFGCRIGDFQRLSMDKISVDNGIPYIHYLPQKTKNEQNDYSEVETPIMRYALDIIKKYSFKFAILKYVSGKSGYNHKIKELIKFCGIDRPCKVFDENIGDNTIKPLYELSSSKLCRKTHVDIMNKVQINSYVAGLHREGSDAVQRYTKLELKDRFTLMCVAFSEPIYSVDNQLNIL